MAKTETEEKRLARRAREEQELARRRKQLAKKRPAGLHFCGAWYMMRPTTKTAKGVYGHDSE